MYARFAVAFSLCVAPVAFGNAVVQGKSTPIKIPSGHILQSVKGALVTNTNQASYTIYAKAGQTMVVNAVGKTSGFAVIATVMFPNGGQDGGKGIPNFKSKLTQTGTYKIVVARNLMASNVSKGQFVLEVALY